MCDLPSCQERASYNRKQCGCCKEFQRYSEFSAGLKKKDLHQPWCKWCMHHYMKFVYIHTVPGVKCETHRKVFSDVLAASKALPYISSRPSHELRVDGPCRLCNYYHVIKWHTTSTAT